MNFFCWAVKLLGEIRNRSLKLRKQKTDFHTYRAKICLSLFAYKGLEKLWRKDIVQLLTRQIVYFRDAKVIYFKPRVRAEP